MKWTHKNLYFSRLWLRAAIFAAVFSIFFIVNYDTVRAADTLVSAADGALYAKDALAGPYWIDTNTAAIIFINGSQDMSYASTTDAGATWNVTTIVAGTAKQAASWFDQETPGDNGTLVHTAWVNRLTDAIYYSTVDISNGNVGTVQTVDSSVTVDDVSSHKIAITKTVSGNLILCFSTLAEVACYKSADGGVSWTAIADAYETATESDWLMLYPANTGDDDDAAGIFWDRDANELSLKMYDDSANTWTETSIATSMVNASSYMNMDAAVRHSDSHILLAAWNAVDTPTADFMTWDLTVDSIALPTVTAKTALMTDQIDAGQAGMVINQQNDDVYLAYLKGTAFGATVDVVYKKSTDGMTTWGSETAYSEAASDDFRIVDGGRTIDNDGGYIQFSFFEDDLNNLFVNLTNDVAIAEGDSWLSGYAYRRAITINSSQVDAIINNFPVLATTTLSSLKTSANGGNVESSNGYDIVWTDSDGLTILDYEVEKYNAATGEIAHWISVDVSPDADKVIYLYYGKSGDSDHSNAAGVWNDEYKAVWHFDETSGAHEDSTANNIDSQTIAVTTQGSATGQINGADDYNNSNNYIDFGDVLELDFPVTISAWIYKNQSSNADPIFSSNYTSVFSGYWLYVNSSNALEVGFGDGGGTGAANALGRLSANNSVSIGDWTYVVGTINGTTINDINAYINGQLDNTGSTGSGTVYEKVNAGTVRLGYRGGTSARMGGIIDEVRISNSIRSAQWISTEYNNQVDASSFLTIASEESLNTAPNAPTLVSPSNASYTADTTPTLSANYSDSDTGDVGTTNYRISSSSLVDCTNNTNVVASGASSETSTNNEDTTYTPGSSIGSDATYYWCAQNNDGVATSSWTQMGTFTLDTTAPTNIGIDSVAADSSSQITVVADTASDSGAGLHSTPYWFDETGGESGATDSSSYQASTTYVDSGLSPNTQYSYRVKAKDAVDNESSYSSASSVYTLANVPSSLSLSGGIGQVSASWSANSNPGGTEYYIENTTAGTNSGWGTSNSWTSSNLSCGTSYSFRVKARNGDSVETSYISSSVSTSACAGSVPAVPAASGVGTNTVSVGIGQTASLGNISTEGTNLLTHIRSQSDFNINISSNGSSQNHSLVISDLDMFSKVVTITLYSEPLVFTMNPGETKKIDFDNDSIYDLQIDYTDLLVNRVELTITNLNTGTETEESYENSLIKYPNNPKVYLIENNQKRWIVDEATFNSLNYSWSDIKTISEDKVYPDGQDIKLSQSKYNFINYLSYGSVGQEVRDLQTLLKELGYFTYPYITGYYGTITTQAVKDFQIANGIQALGVLGPKTREKLNSY